MKKIKLISLLFIFLIIYIYICSIEYIPESITIMQGEKLNISTLWGINVEKTSYTSPNLLSYTTGKVLQTSVSESSKDEILQSGKINFNINLLKNISLKEVTVNVIPKTTVVPLGNAIGLKLYTQGVLVVGMSEIEGKKPYENTGIKEGDRIISVNNIILENTDDLINTVNSSKGKEVKLKYISNNEEKETSIVPEKTKEDEYKLGLWVRDAAARSWNSNIL